MVMREPTYFLLLSLLGGPLHGYGIAKRSQELSEGRVKLAAGTLYGALDRLVGEELIEVDHEEQVSGRRRRYYRITDDGRQATLLEVERMRSAVAVAEAVGNENYGLGGLAVNT